MRQAALLSLVTIAGCGRAASAPPPSGAPVALAAPAPPPASSPAREALPLVAVVRADWCPTCRRIEPTLVALQREYGGRVSFLILDVTDDAASARSMAAADQAGIGAFFRDNNATGIVAVFTRQRAEVAKLAGEADVERYRGPLATAIGTR